MLLDAGAGRGEQYPYDYREHVARVIGVDVTTAVRENDNIDTPVVGDLSALPFADGTFDLVFSKYVLEHLADPLAAFCEIRRVTRPGAPARSHPESLPLRRARREAHAAPFP